MKILIIFLMLCTAAMAQTKNTIFIDDPLINDLAQEYSLSYLIDRRDTLIDEVDGGKVKGVDIDKRKDRVYAFNLYIQQAEQLGLKSDEQLDLESKIEALDEDIAAVNKQANSTAKTLKIMDLELKKTELINTKSAVESSQYDIKTEK